jgi:hypothetical protein
MAEQPNRQFANVWAATWLRPAAYHRRRPSSLAGRALAGLFGKWRRNDGADYFSRIAEIPDLPRDYKVRALAIAMHHRKLAALRQLVVADEA